MMILPFPGIACGEIEGKLDRRMTQKNVGIETDAVHAEPLRLGVRIGHVPPAVEAMMQAESGGVFDQEIAAARQPGERLRAPPMPRCFPRTSTARI